MRELLDFPVSTGLPSGKKIEDFEVFVVEERIWSGMLGSGFLKKGLGVTEWG